MQFTKEELNDILEKHKHWLEMDCDGWENMRANLSGADLSGADLSGADLSRTNLSEANLYGANLYGANLSGADLYGANLYGTNLSEANLYGANLYGTNLSEANLYGTNLSEANLSRTDLSGADLSEANLSRANLYGANLYGANLSRADLYGANLYGANLSGADLSEANLYGTNLSEANLYGTNLSRAKNIPYIPMACPDTGSFTGWKKAWVPREGSSGDEKVICIIQLEIPEDAKRSSATGRKCRCDKALVKSIEILTEGVPVTKAYSYKDYNFVYETGKMVSVDNFDEYRFNECAAGIHFFINEREAIDYKLF